MLEHVKIFSIKTIVLPLLYLHMYMLLLHNWIHLVFYLPQCELQAQATAHSDIKHTIYYFFVWDIVSYPFCLLD